jgi:hypothetical protein
MIPEPLSISENKQNKDSKAKASSCNLAKLAFLEDSHAT